MKKKSTGARSRQAIECWSTYPKGRTAMLVAFALFMLPADPVAVLARIVANEGEIGEWSPAVWRHALKRVGASTGRPLPARNDNGVIAVLVRQP